MIFGAGSVLLLLMVVFLFVEGVECNVMTLKFDDLYKYGLFPCASPSAMTLAICRGRSNVDNEVEVELEMIDCDCEDRRKPLRRTFQITLTLLVWPRLSFYTKRFRKLNT
jgi:hypothetical protein